MMYNNELISEAELDFVAGGNRDELALDSQLWAAMGGRSTAYTTDQITSTNVNGIAAKIDDLWARAGFTVTYNDFGASSYSLNGQAISRNKAIETVLNQLGYHDIDPKQFEING